jgi:hypothetical protein
MKAEALGLSAQSLIENAGLIPPPKAPAATAHPPLERPYAPVWKYFSKVIYNSLNSFET